MNRILIVEDSLTTQTLIQSSLDQIAIIQCVSSIADAEKELNKNNYDLLILDVLLPDGDGFNFCQKLRNQPKFSDLPLIFLTGQTELDDKVKGLKLGGDDYIVKPFAPDELQARVQARLRRKPKDSSTLSVDGFHIDFNAQAVFFKGSQIEQEQNLDLTRIEFKLLVFFLRHIGKTFSRADLLQKVWGESTHVSEHTVDTHISSLRKKIVATGYQIKSVLKQGYKFESGRS